MNISQADILHEVHARLQIEDHMHRWARGADRNDRDLMLSVFHAGAAVDYGTYRGPVEKFVDWVMKMHTEDLTHTRHKIFNMLIELEGDSATSEAGVDCTLGFIGRNGRSELLLLGRYLDRWEKRDGVWKIAHRRSAVDSYRVVTVQTSDEIEPLVKGTNAGLRSSDDISYEYIRTAKYDVPPSRL